MPTLIYSTPLDTSSPDRARVLALIWERFRASLRWPAEKAFMKELRSRGIERKTVELMSGISIREGDTVSASLDALLGVSDVRELFAPLPQLLHLAAERFRQTPDRWDGKHHPKIVFDDFKRIWQDEARARLTATLMRAAHQTLLGGGGRTDDDPIGWFVPRLESLKFEGVSTLDDIATLQRAARIDVREPTGPHLSLIRLIHAELLRTGLWPNPVRFALEHADLGYVPELVEALGRRFFYGNPDYRADDTNELVLTLEALPYADRLVLPLVTNIVKALAAIWDERVDEPRTTVTASELSERLVVPKNEILPILMYLIPEPWFHGGDYPARRRPKDEWMVVLERDIDEFRDLRSWEDYAERRGFQGADDACRRQLRPNSDAAVESAEASDPTTKKLRRRGKSRHVDPKKVFVIHGRNERARKAMFDFLRALHLEPIEWSEAISLTKKGTPYIGDVLDAAFENARAIVALMTGDDEARLRDEFRSAGQPEEKLTPQARPNVLFEAGMALGRAKDRTVFVELGSLRSFSDIAGRHIVRFDGAPKRYQELAQRLKDAGCDVDTSGTDWCHCGYFDDLLEVPKP